MVCSRFLSGGQLGLRFHKAASAIPGRWCIIPWDRSGPSARLRHEQIADSNDDVHARRAGLRPPELDMFFSTYPTVAEGFQLKTWRGGPHAGQPKLPPAAQSLLDRGLMRLDIGSSPPRYSSPMRGWLNSER